MIEILSIFNGE